MVKENLKTEYFKHYAPEVLKRFKEFHRENAHVFDEFIRLATLMKKSGQKRYSAQAIIYKMRWDHDLKTTGEPFKITNDFTSIYSRLLCFQRPEFVGFFKMHNQGKKVIPGERPDYIEQNKAGGIGEKA